MKKLCALAMVLCLGLAASTWAADIPGQKLTDAEASAVRGMGFTLPVGLLANSVTVNGVTQAMTVTATKTGYFVSTNGSLVFPGGTVSAIATLPGKGKE
jgi:hypothetical protein